MTQKQRTIRKERHIAVDVLVGAGCGFLSVAIDHHHWWSVVIAVLLIGFGLWFDRRNALEEEEEAPVEKIEREVDCGLRIQSHITGTNQWHTHPDPWDRVDGCSACIERANSQE